jgi:cation transport regulator ChaC
MSNHGVNSHHIWMQASHLAKLDLMQQQEPMFYYFAYGSCMCPVDLKRSLGENTHVYVVGAGTLKGYKLGFYRFSPTRKCGVLDLVKDAKASVNGVLYQLPWRLSDRLDLREDVPHGGYRQELVDIHCQSQAYKDVRTYVVVNKLATEVAPNDWYFNIVLRGAVTCGLPEEYCWSLFNHMHQLQQSQIQNQSRRSA